MSLCHRHKKLTGKEFPELLWQNGGNQSPFRKPGVLNVLLYCTMDLVQFVVKPTDPFSENKSVTNYQLYTFGEKAISNNLMNSSFHFFGHNNSEIYWS